MSVTDVLEAIESEPQLAAETARALIDALLEEEVALKKLDRVMYPMNPDAAARRRSRRIFEAWHAWIAETERLLRQLRSMKLDGPLHERGLALQTAWADARSLVEMTLDEIENGRAQVTRGETVAGEEVRRELQLSARGRRAG